MTVAASRSLAGVVELLPAGGVEWLVGEAHHRVGEARASVLWDGGAPGEKNG
jgi:hypothetical protein